MKKSEEESQYASTYFANTAPFRHRSNIFLTLLNLLGQLIAMVYMIITFLPKKMYVGSRVNEQEIQPPGPKGHFLLGIYPEISAPGEMSEVYNRLAKTYGRETGICQFTVGPKHFYLVTNPDYCKQVLSKPTLFPRGNSAKTLRFFLGNTAVTTEGDEWKEKSHEIGPHLSPKIMGSYSTIIMDVGERMCARWQQHAERGSSFDLLEEMSRCTMEVISRSMLNMDLSVEMPSATQALDVILAHMVKNFTGILPPGFAAKFPTTNNKAYQQAMATLRRELSVAISNYISQNKHEDGSYYIDERIKAHREDVENGIINQAFIDEIMLIFFAGYDTTSKLLTWTIYEISRNPQVCRELCHEMDTVLQGRNVEFQDLKDLPYLTKLLQESLRVYTPVSTVVRDVVEDTKMGPYTLKRGSYLLLGLRLMAHDPNLWENPSVFNPNRFTDQMTDRTTQYNLIPFIAGKHRCPGRFLALTEAKLLIAMMVQRFNFQIVSQGEVRPITKITLYPDRPLKVTVALRKDACAMDPLMIESENIGLENIEKATQLRRRLRPNAEVEISGRLREESAAISTSGLETKDQRYRSEIVGSSVGLAPKAVFFAEMPDEDEDNADILGFTQLHNCCNSYKS